MTQKFYLRTTAPATGTAPTANTAKSAVFPVSGHAVAPSPMAITERSLLPAKGAAGTTALINYATTTGNYDGLLGRFTSVELAAGTYGSGNWTLAIQTIESNAGVNAFHAQASCYFWRPSTTSVVGYVFDSTSTVGVEVGNNTTSRYGQVLTIAGSDVTIQAGDVLVLEVWVVGNKTDTMTRTVTLCWEGTTDVTAAYSGTDPASYLNAPADIPAHTIVLPDVASATGTGQGAQASIAPNAEAAIATGSALDASVTRTSNPAAAVASATGQAHDATVTIEPQAGVAEGTGTAHQPGVAVFAYAEPALAVGTAHDTDKEAMAETATASGTAHDATVTIGAPQVIEGDLAFSGEGGIEASGIRLARSDVAFEGEGGLDVGPGVIHTSAVTFGGEGRLEAIGMRIIDMEGRCRATAADDRLNTLAQALLDLAVEAVDCQPYDAPNDWTARYPLRYVSIGAPPIDCAQIVAYVADGPRPLPTPGRSSGTMYEVELRVMLASCCAPGPQLANGSYAYPSPEQMAAFARGFNRDVMQLWTELTRVRKEQWGRMGVRCDDPIPIERDRADEGLCFAAEAVLRLPLIPLPAYAREAMANLLDLSPKVLPIQGAAGDDLTTGWLVAEELNGDVIDLTAAAVEAYVWRAGAVVANWTVTVAADPTTGRFQLDMDAATTEALGPGRWDWECVVVVGGKRVTQAWGDMTLLGHGPLTPLGS